MTTDEGDPIKIDDLETYFHYLRDLVYGPDEIATKTPGLLEEGYIFLKLPNIEDEGHFIIKANERKIDTSQFKGVLSVQGDEIAEIVFFEIDRFFDATDLSQMDIAIQWSTKINGVHVEDYTPAFIKYVDPKTDQLIFGWPITSEVTASAGAISFAVRFYKKDLVNNGKLLYSFTTLPAVMNIGASLQVDVANLVADDPTNIILRRLTNSPLDGVEEASTPWFVFSNASNDVDATVELQLYALAAKSSGSLTYQWYYNDNPLMDTWISAADQHCYIPAANRIPDIVTYYYCKSNEYFPISVVNDEKFTEYKKLHGELYINCTTYTLTPDSVQAGTYYVDCCNLRNGKAFYASGDPQNKDLTKVPQWIVKGPTEIVINAEMWPAELMLTDDLSATAAVTSGIEASTEYEWIYQTTNANDATEIPIENASGLTYIPTQEGYYKLKISNTKNRVTTTSTTPLCLVLGEIAEFKPEITKQETDGSYIAHLNRELGYGEKVTYVWKSTNGTELAIGDTYTPDYASLPESGLTFFLFATITKGTTLNLVSNEVRSESPQFIEKTVE